MAIPLDITLAVVAFDTSVGFDAVAAGAVNITSINIVVAVLCVML